jgi:hypothetical protein
MNLTDIIRENKELLKGQSPVQKYKKEMRDLYVNYSTEKSYRSFEKIINSLTGSGKLKQKHIDESLELIKQEFLQVPLSIKLALDKHTKAVYNSILKVKPIIKAEDDLKILDIDPDAISKLTTADIVWILGHAADTEIARLIASTMETLKLQQLSIYETAQELQKIFSEYTPVKFKELFGEERYWKIVTQSQTARITSYANIDNFEQAGYEYYEWVTRPGERTFDCVCPDLDGMIFRVSDARESINNYYEASKIEDYEQATEAMKKADPWITKKDEIPPGIMPQAHGGCYCDIVVKEMLDGLEYDAENRKFKIAQSN